MKPLKKVWHTPVLVFAGKNLSIYAIEAEREDVVFDDLVKFVDQQCRVTKHPVFLTEALMEADGRSNSSAKKRQSFHNVDSGKTSLTTGVVPAGFNGESATPGNIQTPATMCNDAHDLDECRIYESRSLEERRQFLTVCVSRVGTRWGTSITLELVYESELAESAPAYIQLVCTVANLCNSEYRVDIGWDTQVLPFQEMRMRIALQTVHNIYNNDKNFVWGRTTKHENIGMKTFGKRIRLSPRHAQIVHNYSVLLFFPRQSFYRYSWRFSWRTQPCQHVSRDETCRWHAVQRSRDFILWILVIPQAYHDDAHRHHLGIQPRHACCCRCTVWRAILIRISWNGRTWVSQPISTLYSLLQRFATVQTSWMYAGADSASSLSFERCERSAFPWCFAQVSAPSLFINNRNTGSRCEHTDRFVDRCELSKGFAAMWLYFGGGSGSVCGWDGVGLGRLWAYSASWFRLCRWCFMTKSSEMTTKVFETDGFCDMMLQLNEHDWTWTASIGGDLSWLASVWTFK